MTPASWLSIVPGRRVGRGGGNRASVRVGRRLLERDRQLVLQLRADVMLHQGGGGMDMIRRDLQERPGVGFPEAMRAHDVLRQASAFGSQDRQTLFIGRDQAELEL